MTAGIATGPLARSFLLCSLRRLYYLFLSTYIQVSILIVVQRPTCLRFKDGAEIEADSITAQQDGTALAATELTQTQAQAQIQPMQIGLPGSSEHADDLRDHPERDYYTQSPWVKDFIMFIILDMIGSTLQIFVLNGIGSQKLVTWLIPSLYFWEWLPIYQFLGLLLFVLFSFLIEEFSLYEGHRLNSRVRQRRVKIFRYTLIIALLYLEVTPILFDFTVFIFFGVYVCICLCWR